MSREGMLALRIGAICAAGLLVSCSSSPQAKEAKFLKRGQALLADKQYGRAILEFSNAAKVMPKDAEPYYQMGLTHLESGDPVRAVVAFQKATTLNPKHAGAQVKLAGLMTTSQTKGVIEDAEKRLQDVLAAVPDSLDALNSLAVAESRLGRPDDAAKLLDQAVEKYPEDLRAAALLARLKLNKNDQAGAEDILRKVVEHAPKSADAALMVGRFYIQLHKDNLAEVEIRRALALDPQNAPALLSMALLHRKSNRMAEAEQCYQRLAALPNKGYNPIYGLYLYQQGRRDAALAEFLRLAKADPDDRDARTRLLAIYMTMGKNAEAESVLAVALKHNPKDTEALLQRSELRLRNRDLTGAAGDLQTVLRFKPDSPEAHFQMAKLKNFQGNSLSVRQELTQSLLLNPNYLPARISLAWYFVSSNDAKSALELINQTPPSQRNNLELSIKRTWALLALGNQKEARQQINIGLNVARVPELLEQDGFLKMKEGDFAGARADAEELLQRFPEQDPENLRAVRLLVDSCEALHQKPKAVETLRAVAAQHPKSAPLQTLLGRVLLAFGNRAEAHAAFEAAQNIDPKSPDPKMELAQMAVTDNRLDEARQILTAVITADSRNLTAMLALADTEAATGLRPSAIARYRSVLSLDQSNVPALRSLAGLIVLDNPDEALKFARQAVEISPDDASTQDTLGWIFYRKGIYRSAVEHLKLAVAKESTPSRQFHLAMSYMKTGEQNLGQQILAAALKQDPNLAKTEQGW